MKVLVVLGIRISTSFLNRLQRENKVRLPLAYPLIYLIYILDNVYSYAYSSLKRTLPVSEKKYIVEKAQELVAENPG